MASLLAPARGFRSFQCLKLIAQTSPHSLTCRRAVSTLENSPHIYIHQQSSKSYILSLLPTTPPTPSLALGTSTTNPPTPESLTENPDFLHLLHTVIKQRAVHDPDVIAQAAMYTSQSGSSLGSGGVFFAANQPPKRKRAARLGTNNDGSAGATSKQGGMGGAGRGGYIHVSDQRQPPDFGRVAWPEDIFGSLEVDGDGKFVDGHGRYQEAGTYRICTHQGVLGLSPYLRGKVVERLRELEGQMKTNG